MAYLWTGDLLSHLFDMCDLAGIGRLMNSIFHVQEIENMQDVKEFDEKQYTFKISIQQRSCCLFTVM